MPPPSRQSIGAISLILTVLALLALAHSGCVSTHVRLATSKTPASFTTGANADAIHLTLTDHSATLDMEKPNHSEPTKQMYNGLQKVLMTLGLMAAPAAL